MYDVYMHRQLIQVTDYGLDEEIFSPTWSKDFTFHHHIHIASRLNTASCPLDTEVYSALIKQPELTTCFHLVKIYVHPLTCFHPVGLSHMGKFTFNPSSWYPKYVLARL
jgi:hypothetical protein